jgi:putative cell wall-binding protein
MRSLTSRLRAAATAGVVGVTAAAGLAGLTIPAHADASFSFTRLAGNDRYATAGAMDQAAYPSGAPGASVFLADGLSAHAPDALAASGLEGVKGIGVLLTDNNATVPSSTLSALSANKVHNIGVLGGTASVSQAQINQLTAAGYTVVTPYQGSTRYQTMKLIDESISASQVGTDGSGNPTAILASGDPAHYVDALSAGALAYAKKFPIILTNSTTSTLQPEAQQVITDLGIKDLIVVGGTGSIPSSQYTPDPTGVTQVEVEYGSDRSATSVALANFAVVKGWLSAAHLDLARGDDGADALAGSAFGGVNSYPTVITDSTTADGSAPDFATQHASTLTGTSYIFGGTGAVTASQASDVTNAAGAAKPAQAGAISPSTGQQVNSVNGTTFTQGGLAYTYGSGDTYQVVEASSSSPSPACTSTSYAVFQASITQGDTVSGTYAPSAKSTFCLSDVAPRPPSSVTAAPNATAGGI